MEYKHVERASTGPFLKFLSVLKFMSAKYASTYYAVPFFHIWKSEQADRPSASEHSNWVYFRVLLKFYGPYEKFEYFELVQLSVLRLVRRWAVSTRNSYIFTEISDLKECSSIPGPHAIVWIAQQWRNEAKCRPPPGRHFAAPCRALINSRFSRRPFFCSPLFLPPPGGFLPPL